MSALYEQFGAGLDARSVPLLHPTETYLLAAAAAREVQGSHRQIVDAWRQNAGRYADILSGPLPGAKFVGSALWIPLFSARFKHPNISCVGFWRISPDTSESWIAWRGNGPQARDAYAVIDPMPQNQIARLSLGGSIRDAVRAKANLWSPQDAAPRLKPLRDGLQLVVVHAANTQAELDLVAS